MPTENEKIIEEAVEYGLGPRPGPTRDPGAVARAAASRAVERMEQRHAGVVEALREISEGSPPDDWEPYEGGYPCGYERPGDPIRVSGVDESNAGDVADHAAAVARWECAKIARRALASLAAEPAPEREDRKDASCGGEEPIESVPEVAELHGVPRRCFVQRRTPTETAIFKAMQMVEDLGCDVRLTDAVCLLQYAADAVGDFVDGIEKRRFVREVIGMEDVATGLHRKGVLEQCADGTRTKCLTGDANCRCLVCKVLAYEAADEDSVSVTLKRGGFGYNVHRDVARFIEQHGGRIFGGKEGRDICDRTPAPPPDEPCSSCRGTGKILGGIEGEQVLREYDCPECSAGPEITGEEPAEDGGEERTEQCPAVSPGGVRCIKHRDHDGPCVSEWLSDPDEDRRNLAAQLAKVRMRFRESQAQLRSRDAEVRALREELERSRFASERGAQQIASLRDKLAASERRAEEAEGRIVREVCGVLYDAGWSNKTDRLQMTAYERTMAEIRILWRHFKLPGEFSDLTREGGGK